MTAKGKNLPPGKVPWDLIADLVKTALPPDVLLGPGHGEDAALVKMGDELWAVASDPVTFTSGDAGRLSVVVNANDVAVRGAVPRFFTAVVLMSEKEGSPDQAKAVLAQIRDACASMGIALIGGHTEVTPGLGRTVIAGTMLGRVAGRPITTGGLGEGDLIAMTKWAGLEGTAILMNDFEGTSNPVLGDEGRAGTRERLAGEWLSILPEAAAAASIDGVTALHDVTEGGVGEALHELASASGRNLHVDPGKIPLLEETRRICARLGLDPFGLIGSGALLIGCAPGSRDALERALAAAGVPFAWIGEAGKAHENPSTGLPRFERDEILKACPEDP